MRQAYNGGQPQIQKTERSGEEGSGRCHQRIDIKQAPSDFHGLPAFNWSHVCTINHSWMSLKICCRPTKQRHGCKDHNTGRSKACHCGGGSLQIMPAPDGLATALRSHLSQILLRHCLLAFLCGWYLRPCRRFQSWPCPMAQPSCRP